MAQNNHGAPDTGATDYAEAQIQDSTKDIFSGNLTIAQALAKLRARLLDLSTRNKLLNIRFPKGRSLRFTDVKNLDVIYEKLIDGRQATLAQVPEPTEDEYQGEKPDPRDWARTCGINVDYDLAPAIEANSRGAIKLQTLFYPEALERLAKKMANEARTVIEETGSNMLYLVFGLLEFYEADHSDRPLLAPLLAVPVTLLRGDVDPETRIYRYHLQHNGEDVTENFTLREKLKADFRLNLPELQEEQLPEAYFKAVADSVKNKRRWRIRRQLSLGMLSFGKLAIWADLDPAKYPHLLKHPLLRSLFEGAKEGGALHGEDYEIDSNPQANLPLIYDADSSQHSAVIDAMAGKSMVINGPPGTGKSQTITNIIASCLWAGKRVLFVSEKVAALEVVRHRLDRANLGHFVLELHSHNSQKKKLLEDIQARVDAKFKAPAQIEAKVRVLKEQKRKLQRHAELMGMVTGNELGLSMSEVFWGAERRRQALADLDQHVQKMTIPAAQAMTHEEAERRRSLLGALGDRYSAAGGVAPQHPWTGFEPALLTPGDEQEIGDIAAAALREAERLQAVCENFLVFGSGPIAVAQIQRLTPELLAMPPPPERFNAALLPRFFSEPDPFGTASRVALDAIGQKLSLIRAVRQQQREVLRPEIAIEPTEGGNLRSAAEAERGGHAYFSQAVLKGSIESLGKV